MAARVPPKDFSVGLRKLLGIPAGQSQPHHTDDKATDLDAIVASLAKRVLQRIKRSTAINRPEDVNQLINSMLQLIPRLSDEQKAQIKDLLREEIADDVKSLLTNKIQRQQLLRVQAAEDARAKIINASTTTDPSLTYLPETHGGIASAFTALFMRLFKPLVTTITFVAEQTKHILQLLAKTLVFVLRPTTTTELIEQMAQPIVNTLRPAHTTLETRKMLLPPTSSQSPTLPPTMSEELRTTTPRPKLTPFRITPF